MHHVYIDNEFDAVRIDGGHEPCLEITVGGVRKSLELVANPLCCLVHRRLLARLPFCPW